MGACPCAMRRGAYGLYCNRVDGHRFAVCTIRRGVSQCVYLVRVRRVSKAAHVHGRTFVFVMSVL